MHTEPSTSPRREFLKSAVLAGASFAIAGCASTGHRFRRRQDKLNIAVIGCGGKGYSDMMAVAHENVVALAEVDAQSGARAFEAMPHARRYQDYRDLLDAEADLDAVVISTPDHSHAPAAVRALERGLHVFCQKPLTQTVMEARVLRVLAARKRVATQMGNQGTAMDGFRTAVEVIRSGAIGAVRQVHVWTNRPIWPQGIARPQEIEAIPEHLRFDLFLGPAPYRPYNRAYTPFAWRGFWDYGTGALGDMACHIMNLPYMALMLGAPRKVWAEQVDGLNEETAPRSAVIHFEFPARRSFPEVRLTWYDGNLKPDAALLDGRPFAEGGSLLVGDEGMLYSADDYGREFTLLPEAKFAGYRPPEPSLPRVELPAGLETSQIHLEWLAACRGEVKASSGFDHAGPFSEAILLGNVALRAQETLHWDGVRGRLIGGSERAAALLSKAYARGFEVDVDGIL